MPLSKVRRLVAVLLRSLGCPQSAADAIEGLYSFRRVLPTLAHKSEFYTTERLDVGGWTDAKEKGRATMPNLNSAATLHMQNNRKSELIFMARETHAQFFDSEIAGSYNSDPSWELLFSHWPQRNSLRSQAHISECLRKKGLHSSHEVVLPCRDDGHMSASKPIEELGVGFGQLGDPLKGAPASKPTAELVASLDRHGDPLKGTSVSKPSEELGTGQAQVHSEFPSEVF